MNIISILDFVSADLGKKFEYYFRKLCVTAKHRSTKIKLNWIYENYFSEYHTGISDILAQQYSID
jgi:hypothetical protein